MNDIEKRLVRKLNEIYPDKKVISLAEKDRSLYTEIRKYGQENNLKPSQVIKKMGFQFIRNKTSNKNVNEQSEIFRKKLNELFPDKQVIALQEKDPLLYADIRRLSAEHNKKPQEFIKQLGFIPQRKKRREENADELLKELKDALIKAYPDYIIKNPTQKKKLYFKIRAFINAQNITIDDFFKQNGFTYIRENESKYPIDPLCIKILHNEYDCKTTSEFPKWFGVTRQNINRLGKFNPKRKPKKIWGETLEEVEIKHVLQVIKNREFSSDKDAIIRIYKHKFEKGQFAIFYKDHRIIKCLTKIPTEILSEMINNRYHELNEQDFNIQKLIEKKGVIKGNDLKLDTKKDSDLIKLLVSRMQNSKWDNRKDYIHFLGWNYIEANKSSYEELREKLRVRVLPFIDDDGYFRMGVADEGYHNLKNTFSRKGFKSTAAAMEFLGFKYERTRIMPTEEKYREKLKSYIVYDNKVYIHSIGSARFYMLLMFYGQRRGMSLNELISYLGYERLYKEQLPDGFIPYIPEEDDKRYNLVEEFQDKLDELIIDDKINEILLGPEDKLYQDLENFAKGLDKSIFELLEEWGYILSDQNPYLTNKLNQHQQSHLEKIKDVQGTLEISKTQLEKIKRSQALVREIKKLYNHRCQICSHNVDNTIPYIIKSDGTPYVEVHHIVKLSEADLGISEFEIDSFENVIVVCAHHHRCLHYQNGGYEVLDAEEDGFLYFFTKDGDKLKVHHNLHLKPIKN